MKRTYYGMQAIIAILILISTQLLANEAQITLSLKDDKQHFFEGEDTPEIHFSVSEDLYLLLFHIDSEGKLLMLWPDPYSNSKLDNLVKKDGSTIIPSNYYFSGDHSGKESIQAFGFNDENDEIAALKQVLAKKAVTGEYIDNLCLETLKTANASQTVSFYYNLSPSHSQINRDVFVLSIGISQYKNAAVKDLTTAGKDAVDFAEKLTHCYSAQNVRSRLLIDDAANIQTIRRFLSNDIYSFINENSIVYIYFSGHGTQLPDENGDEKDHFDEALVPCDFSYYNMYNTLLIDDELYGYYKQIGQHTQNLFIIVDACYSADSIKGCKAILYDTSLKASEQQNVDAMENEIEQMDENFIFMSASGGDQRALEDPEKAMHNSIFTYYLLQSLSGAADSNNDSFISPEEILAYAAQEMNKWCQIRKLPAQTPILINPNQVNLLIPSSKSNHTNLQTLYPKTQTP